MYETFRGISKRAFDEGGNYSIGLKEHTVFPEINPDDIEKAHGVQITIVTSAKNKEEGSALLTALGFPFKRAYGKRRERRRTKLYNSYTLPIFSSYYGKKITHQ